MQAILVRTSDMINPEYNTAEAKECAQLEKPYPVPKTIKAPPGTKIEHPDAWRLCKLGVAIPGDKECQERCGMTDEQLAKVIAANERMNQGIGAYDVPELNKLVEKKAE